MGSGVGGVVGLGGGCVTWAVLLRGEGGVGGSEGVRLMSRKGGEGGVVGGDEVERVCGGRRVGVVVVGGVRFSQYREP